VERGTREEAVAKNLFSTRGFSAADLAYSPAWHVNAASPPFEVTTPT